jgi:hypothetical protein
VCYGWRESDDTRTDQCELFCRLTTLFKLYETYSRKHRRCGESSYDLRRYWGMRVRMRSAALAATHYLHAPREAYWYGNGDVHLSIRNRQPVFFNCFLLKPRTCWYLIKGHHWMVRKFTWQANKAAPICWGGKVHASLIWASMRSTEAYLAFFSTRFLTSTSRTMYMLRRNMTF